MATRNLSRLLLTTSTSSSPLFFASLLPALIEYTISPNSKLAMLILTKGSRIQHYQTGKLTDPQTSYTLCHTFILHLDKRDPCFVDI